MCERKTVVSSDVSFVPLSLRFSLILQVVGVAARQGRVWNSANTVVKVKQLLGRRFLIVFYIFNAESSSRKWV